MAPSKKGKKPTKAAPSSKVKKTREPRAIKKRKRIVFTEEEVFLYRAIKNGNPKFDHQAIGNALGKSSAHQEDTADTSEGDKTPVESNIK